MRTDQEDGFGFDFLRSRTDHRDLTVSREIGIKQSQQSSLITATYSGGTH